LSVEPENNCGRWYTNAYVSVCMHMLEIEEQF